MPIVTVVPDATVSGASSFTITGGLPTVNATLSDSSDSTFIAKASGVVGSASALVDFGTTTITSSQTVKRVRIRARLLTPNANGRINIYLGTRVNNQNYYHSALAARGTLTLQTLVGPWQNNSPSGTAWTQAAINGLRGKVTEYNDSADVGNIYELFIDVDVSNKPTTTVSSPTGTITTTASPDVLWVFADTDGETQTYYQIKVFTQAQYSAGGFNALTAIATFDSGQVASTDNTAPVGTLLNAGIYRAYVRTAKTINGAPFFSDYAFSDFTISVTPPSIPTMAVAWNSSLGYATFTLTGTSPTGFASQYYVVQRSDDGGTTYTTIRDGATITPDGSFVGITYDYEAPRGITVYYRARAVGVTSGSVEIPTQYGTVQGVLITNDGTWWFKVIDNPSLNQGNVRVLRQIDVTITEPNTVFRPLGSTRPIVVAGPLQGEDGKYQLLTVSSAEYTNIFPVLTYQGTILVQDPFGNQKYIRITSREYTAETVNGVIQRSLNIGYVQVSGS